MPNIFKPSSNSLAKISVVAAATVPWMVIWAGSTFSRSPFNTNVGVPVDQPVPFSHQHHAAELGIDCRYCHTPVEKAAYAGIPPTETCMSCHSQIWTNSPLLQPVRDSYASGTPIKWQDGSGQVGWNKVNKTPAFVYFNHSIHVNRGINCNTCHGPIQKMHLTYKGATFQMKWCLDCHNAPEKFLLNIKPDSGEKLLPRDQVFALYDKYMAGSANLTVSERLLLNGLPRTATEAEIKEGKELVKERGINVKQLADCWICHR